MGLLLKWKMWNKSWKDRVHVELLLSGFFPVLLSLKPVKLRAHFKVSSLAIQWLNKGIFLVTATRLKTICVVNSGAEWGKRSWDGGDVDPHTWTLGL